MKGPFFTAGIDIGGTRIKMGIVELPAGHVVTSGTFDTEKVSESIFWTSISTELDRQLLTAGLSGRALAGVGLSVGSYVYQDGSIDGMASFVPFLIPGYSLQEKAEKNLRFPVYVDNDARLISLAEAVYGSGRGFGRSLTITLGSGVGVGLCVNGRPFGEEAFMHLAGHIKVRSGGEIPCLDAVPCYCGLSGCFESTCSGASLEKYVKCQLGPEATNQEMFALALGGNQIALSCLDWYLKMLSAALNQYVYIYCPDVIVLGGGVSKGLVPWEDELNRRIVAEVHTGQHTVVRISSLLENSGILGAASLFLN